METLEEKINRVAREEITIVDYNSCWAELFEEEKQHLLAVCP